MKRTYRLCAIDVWGNARDGYDINSVCYVSPAAYVTVDLSDVASDDDIIKLVRKAFGHRADSRAYTCEADEYQILLYRKGEPAYLVRV